MDLLQLLADRHQPLGWFVRAVLVDRALGQGEREAVGEPTLRAIERQVMLSIIDQHWREHLFEMDYLREGINLRAMGLVFTSLLSLIPLLAFSFAILKVFGAHRDLEPIVYEFFRPVGAATATELTARVMSFADRRLVDGFLLPYRVSTQTPQRVLETLSFDEVRVNPPLRKDDFQP